jgi:hypothetical protein
VKTTLLLCVLSAKTYAAAPILVRITPEAFAKLHQGDPMVRLEKPAEEPAKPLVDPGAAVRHLAGPPAGFTGLWRTWYKDAGLASEVTYRQGLRSGPFVTWHPNGQKWSKGTLITSLPDGEVRGSCAESYDGELIRWYPDGKVQELANFKDGVRHGKYETWDNDGGAYWKREEAHYHQGILQGAWVHWDRPGVRTEVTYSDGLRQGWGRQLEELTGRIIWEEFKGSDQTCMK